MWAPHVGEISDCIECQLQQLNRSPNTLVTAAEMDDRGGGGDAKRWPWWAAASAAQAAAGLAWFRRGRSGTAVAMPFKAFGIASLFVGSGATAVAAGVLAAGVGSVRRLVEATANGFAARILADPDIHSVCALPLCNMCRWRR